MTRMPSGHPETLVMSEPPALGESPWVWVGAGTNTAFAGPWGISYAASLAPDENTGIGIWTEQIFFDTLKNGRHWGVARPILPPMPWQSTAKISDEDLRAMYAYLRTFLPCPVTPTTLRPEPRITRQGLDSGTFLEYSKNHSGRIEAAQSRIGPAPATNREIAASSGRQ